MACTFHGFLAYARLTEDNLEEAGESETARLCYRAAMDAARSCGIPVDTIENAKMELYIYALALHKFDNRGFQPITTSLVSEQYRQRKMTQWKIELEAEGWKVPTL